MKTLKHMYERVLYGVSEGIGNMLGVVFVLLVLLMLLNLLGQEWTVRLSSFSS